MVVGNSTYELWIYINQSIVNISNQALLGYIAAELDSQYTNYTLDKLSGAAFLDEQTKNYIEQFLADQDRTF